MVQDPTPSITNIHHVNISVPTDQLIAAHDFYCDFLGLPEIHRPDVFSTPGFWINVGDADIHIGVQDGIDRHRQRHHTAFQVDDLAAWRARLEAIGIAIEDPAQFTGWTRFQFRDPWGNYLEMIQPLGEQDR